MKKFTAGGAIGMLLTLLIISLLFILMMPTLKNTATSGISGSSVDTKSVEEQVNRQVEEIQNMRQQVNQQPVDTDY